MEHCTRGVSQVYCPSKVVPNPHVKKPSLAFPLSTIPIVADGKNGSMQGKRPLVEVVSIWACNCTSRCLSARTHLNKDDDDDKNRILFNCLRPSLTVTLFCFSLPYSSAVQYVILTYMKHLGVRVKEPRNLDQKRGRIGFLPKIKVIVTNRDIFTSSHGFRWAQKATLLHWSKEEIRKTRNVIGALSGNVLMVDVCVPGWGQIGSEWERQRIGRVPGGAHGSTFPPITAAAPSCLLVQSQVSSVLSSSPLLPLLPSISCRQPNLPPF